MPAAPLAWSSNEKCSIRLWVGQRVNYRSGIGSCCPHLEGLDSSFIGLCSPRDTVDSQHPTRLQHLSGMVKKSAFQKGGRRA